LAKNKTIVAWCMYDWANSSFATTIMTAFFPIFFKSFWNFNVEPTVSTGRLGLATGIGGLAVALLSPILGAMADAGHAKKKFLTFFMLLGVLATASFFFVPRGLWQAAFFLIVCAEIGFSCGNLFYDSLLVNVASRDEMDLVSSRGYAFGYIGGGLLFAINVIMVAKPHLFGFSSNQMAVKASFPMVSVWWLVFALPLLWYVKEPQSCGKSVTTIIANGLQIVVRTFKKIVRQKPLWMFLVAYWLYIDGIYTVIFMATDFGLAIGLSPFSLMLSILLVQFVAAPSSIAFGHLAKRIGTIKAILLGISMYICICLAGALFLRTSLEFMIIALFVGMAQGGVQALSRSYFGKLIPFDEAAEYFGFFNLVGKFSAILGPLCVGGVAYFLHQIGMQSHMASRIAMSSIVIFFIAGGILLYKAGLVQQHTNSAA
jgi:MFS transporter, UMF1 family